MRRRIDIEKVAIFGGGNAIASNDRLMRNVLNPIKANATPPVDPQMGREGWRCSVPDQTS